MIDVINHEYPSTVHHKITAGIREYRIEVKFRASSLKKVHSLFAKKDKEGTILKWPTARISIPMFDVSRPIKKKNPERRCGNTSVPSRKKSFIANNWSTSVSI
jgi:hypothetical protein